MILNRMSEKARRELLFPAPKKSGSARSALIKHDPLAEFRASPYTNSSPEAPTFLEHLASAFKNAMGGAALDMPDVHKTTICRLTWVEGDRISIYGIPQLFMSTTRSANAARTPDIRTRAIVPEWACYITVSFQKPMLSARAVGNLLAAAGMTQGVGDWRNEKGSGSYGAFELVNEDNKDFQRIIREGGREAQIAAMKAPEFYDDETAELFTWFEKEVVARGKADQLQEGMIGVS
jgi:hypothetical protein